jgi:hypothetical protein
LAPTSDERREVAEKERRDVADRLRDCVVYAKKYDLNGDYVMGSDKCVETRSTLYNDIASCVEECGNFTLSAEQVFTRLADLIDPTCHIEYDDWASEQCIGPMLSCDRCGNALPEINGPYQYCPCCGARVVRDDDN